MKRLLFTGLVAMAVLAINGPRASAYCKFQFGFGFNIGIESGNNSCLFGLFKSGPHPGCGSGGPIGNVDGHCGPQGCLNGPLHHGQKPAEPTAGQYDPNFGYNYPYSGYPGAAAQPTREMPRVNEPQGPTQASYQVNVNQGAPPASPNAAMQSGGYPFGNDNFELPSYWYGR